MEQNNQKTKGNMSTAFAIRCLAACYVFYSLFDIVRGYFGDGEDKPSLLLLVLAIVVLGGGGLFIARTAYKEWKRDPNAQPADEEEDEDSSDDTAEEDVSSAALPEETEESEMQP